MIRRTILLPVVVSLLFGLACAGSQPQAARASASPKATVVYVTKTGAKYHVDGCRYLRQSRIPMKLEDAKKAGYTPCSVCRPPR